MTSYASKAGEGDWKYPQAKRNRDGLLRVSKQPSHEIYWHEYGNQKGEPVLFLHGGPGGESSSKHARFFDPSRFRIILFDQRGCGRSIPNASKDPVGALKANTTKHLIGDVERLRRHLRITGKMHVFGGSWGSTLALAYAIEFAQNVQSLILRGIFLCRKKDLDYLYQGNAKTYHLDPYDSREPGAYMAFPEAWQKFVTVIPEKDRNDMVAAYARIFASSANTQEEAKAWSVWEGSTSNLAKDMSDLGKFEQPAFAKAFARIENHYFMNGGFLGDLRGEQNRENNYILEHVESIVHLPIWIVHGRYDQVCPRFQLDELLAQLKAAAERRGCKAKVSYLVTAAGHSWNERENVKALTEIMDKLPPMSCKIAASKTALATEDGTSGSRVPPRQPL